MIVNIANPIYDVVFKYLMDDKKVARKLLSLIIGKPIVALSMKPTERRGELAGRGICILHLDFAAEVDFGKEGCKKVLIELQKAKYHSDIMRFRRYLAAQYADNDNVVEAAGLKKNALPILTIYFLGYPLDHVKAPVIRVERQYLDAATGKSIKEQEAFIESLTHDSIIIQIPYLKDKRKTKLEQVLSVFDASSKHFINIESDQYPEEYSEVIRRLQAAAARSEIRINIEIEEEYLTELADYERELDQKEEVIEQKEQVIEQKEQVIEQKEQVIEQKEQVIEQKEQVIEQKEQVIEQKEQVIEQKEQVIEQIASEKEQILNASKKALMDKLGISAEEAKKILVPDSTKANYNQNGKNE